MKRRGKLVDIHERNIYPAEITVFNGKIQNIEPVKDVPDVYIMPGLIDAHIHIESSMITPGAFALTAVRHGTTAVVSDPHEIANVLGVPGVEFMLGDAAKVPLRFYFGAPSCVPATNFESNGASLGHNDVRNLLKRDEINYLSEMMNYPGVIYDDKEVLLKIKAAKELGKPIDGHAPGLTGGMLRKYIAAGISTDHECSTLEEAEEKIYQGMKILIREGSAARNLSALKDLYKSSPGMVMLCSDDLHPEMLMIRHINKLIADLIDGGLNIYDVIRSATINPAIHYSLESGLLRKGDSADFILVDSLNKMNVSETWIRGEKVYSEGQVNFIYEPGKPVNNFNCRTIKEKDIEVINKHSGIRIIEAFDGELLTGEIIGYSGPDELMNADIKNDILKIVVKDRYHDYPPATGFIRGFGLKKGAFASSVAHDSHNIICIGTNDRDITNAINEIVRMKGGLAVSSGKITGSLGLDIGGIMTTRPCFEVAADYEILNELVKSLGCKMKAPFMTLSFMALLVIPSLKIGDRGLFDVDKFKQVPLFLG